MILHAAFGLPLFERLVIKQLWHVETPLEICLRVRVSQEMATGSDVPNGLHRFVEIIPADALRHR